MLSHMQVCRDMELTVFNVSAECTIGFPELCASTGGLMQKDVCIGGVCHLGTFELSSASVLKVVKTLTWEDPKDLSFFDSHWYLACPSGVFES